MTCTDWGMASTGHFVWILVGLLVVNLAYQIYSDIRFRRKQNEIEQQLAALEESEWPVQ